MPLMFADYTAMMQRDEALALQLRNKFQEKLEEEVRIHYGRILEMKGDGGMCIFTSNIEAVRAAMSLQLAMQVPPVVPLRIGIHTGDIVLQEDNIYGAAKKDWFGALTVENMRGRGCAEKKRRTCSERSNDSA